MNLLNASKKSGDNHNTAQIKERTSTAHIKCRAVFDLSMISNILQTPSSSLKSNTIIPSWLGSWNERKPRTVRAVGVFVFLKFYRLFIGHFYYATVVNHIDTGINAHFSDYTIDTKALLLLHIRCIHPVKVRNFNRFFVN